ncbi:Complement component 1 Q subcomponent-binding protein, mitochondrial-like isoform X1 [Aphelenchoides besseyi]|nr:Complement component 1 Q subcomponent-binding protein, mitochondrial-like isoform X1 [Aphelenchoides besseyi]
MRSQMKSTQKSGRQIRREAERDLEILHRQRRLMDNSISLRSAFLDPQTPQSSNDAARLSLRPMTSNTRLRAPHMTTPTNLSSSDEESNSPPAKFSRGRMNLCALKRQSPKLSNHTEDDDNDIMIVNEIKKDRTKSLQKQSNGSEKKKNAEPVSEIYSNNMENEKRNGNRIRLSNTAKLVNLLAEEIGAEQNVQQNGNPCGGIIDGYALELDQSDVVLRKTIKNSTSVKISFTINNTLVQPNGSGYPISLPTLSIEISNAIGRLFFILDITVDSNNFDFLIREFFATSSSQDDKNAEEVKRKAYVALSCYTNDRLIQGYQNYLVNEVGLTRDFCRKLVSFSTDREHELYVTTLKKIKDILTIDTLEE